MTKEEIEEAVAYFKKIQERKKLPAEKRWSKSDQLLAQALIANGFETVLCYRERQGDDFYIGVTGNGKWAFFNVGDIFFDLMKGETVTLRYIAEMLPEPSGEGDDTDEK